MKQTQLSPAQRLMQEHPEAYEQYMLIAFDGDEDFYKQVLPFLCVDNSSVYKPAVNNFESALHYGLFLAIKEWHAKLKEGRQAFTRVNDAGLMTSLWILAHSPRPVVTEDHISHYIDTWHRLKETITLVDAVATVGSTWKEWLSAQKTKHFAKVMLRLDGQDATARTKEHERELSEIQAAGLDDDFDTLDSIMQEEDNDAEHFPMSPSVWAQLNESLGGGFRRGEHSMFVVPSGGGKTVMACQIMADMACSCKNVLFVSTEETLSDLWPRILSAMSYRTTTRVPYQRVKGRPKFRTYLPDTLIEMAEGVMNQIKHHMLFADWTGKREAKKNLEPKNYNIDMIDGEIKKASEKFAKQGEKLDVVILDWLGATLQNGIPDKEIRHVYAAAAKKMCEVARAYDVATISMVQATGKGSDKAKLDHNDIAECHSLHHLAVACIGISHLKHKETGEGSAATDSFKDHQCFNVSKSRFGKPMTFWMRENFDFMRFDLPTTRD